MKTNNMTARIILIRHGETEWNAQKRYLGSSDIGLNAKGVRQAKLAAGKLRGEPISKCYASDSRRAFDFAGIAFGSRPVKKLKGLREMDFGILEGLTHGRIMEKYPEEYGKWLEDPLNNTLPDGESFAVLKKRVIRSFARIISENKGSTAAVVTHSGPIRVILGRILKDAGLWQINPENGGISIINFEGGNAAIETLNGVPRKLWVK